MDRKRWIRENRRYIEGMAVFVALLLMIVGCIYEADRDNASLGYRAAERVYKSGTAPGSEDAKVLLKTTGQLRVKLGDPITEEPLTATSADAAVAGSNKGIERDKARNDFIFNKIAWAASAVGVPGLGIAAHLLRKEKRKVRSAIAAGQDIKSTAETLIADFKDAKKDGKIDMADAIALAIKIRGAVGPAFEKAAAIRNVGEELHNDYLAMKKAT